METKAGFDLNQSIHQWRDALAQSAALRTEELDELEHHLRDSVLQLRERQLSEEESFLVAARRLGGNERLAHEFGKVNPGRVWRSRLIWMLSGVFLLYFSNGLPNLVSQFVWRVAAPNGINGHLLGLLVVLARWTAVFVPFAAFLWFTSGRPQFLSRWKGHASERPVRTALALIFLSLLALGFEYLPSLFVASRWGIPSPKLMATFHALTAWQTIGHGLLMTILIPIVIVWLVRQSDRLRKAN